MVAQYGRIEHGMLLCSEGIQLAADTLQTVYHLQGAPPAGTFEGDVLAEMSHTLFTGRFIAGAGIYAITAIYHR